MKKQPAKNGKMTLDKLARIVERGFDKIDENFIEVNEKFELVTTKKELQALREEMNERFEGVDQCFQGIDNKIDALYFEVKDLKSAIPPLITTIGHLEGEMLSVRQRLSRLEKKAGLAK